MNQLRLTQTVQKGGCAAKVAASELRLILSQVKFPPMSEQVLVDGAQMDDAAIVKINDDLALVQTLDFFTPIVDSPFVFGQVAAANALSDVYAMGGAPKTAMAILAFPTAIFDPQVIVQLLQGASDKMREAKADFVGGHSIDDDSLKFGLSVTGFVSPGQIWSNDKAQVGDVLVLTKPLGTGAATAALKRSETTEEGIAEVIQSMCQLNNVIDFLPAEILPSIHGATDITGFGLCGHAMQMAKASSVSMNFKFSKIPFFQCAPGFLEKGFLTKAHRTNREYVFSSVDFGTLGEIQKLLLFDPQTSGGLLLSVAAEHAVQLCHTLKAQFHSCEIIGSVVPEDKFKLIFQD